MNAATTVRFTLPPAGIFKPNNEDDPLPYYYKPVIGSIYRARIQGGLNLLTPPYGRVLEFGYGSGILLPSLGALGADLHGVDLNSDPVETQACLRAVGISADLRRGDLLSASYPDGSFDLIVAFSVFEHIADPEPILVEMHRILADFGTLLVGMPRVDKAMERLFSIIGFSGIEKHHVTTYRQIIDASRGRYSLARMTSLPSWLPKAFGMYFNMLFKKKTK